jgi:hypothetical protein
MNQELGHQIEQVLGKLITEFAKDKTDIDKLRKILYDFALTIHHESYLQEEAI